MKAPSTPVHVPGTVLEHGSRVDAWRPVVHEVIEAETGGIEKGPVVWRADQTFRNRGKARRFAFLAWAAGDHEEGDE